MAIKKQFKVEIELEQHLRKQIYNALQGPVIESLIGQLSDHSSDKYWRSTMEGHSFKVEKKMMSHLYDLFYGVKDSLGFTDPIDFYITGDASVNAFSVASQKKGEPHIVNINSALIELMTDDELKFVVGHEIGHLINQDTELWRLIQFVFPAGTQTPLVLQYKIRLRDQLCELVADRYGYLAMPDLKACVSAFFKMSSGLDISKLDVEMDAFIEQNIEHLDYFLNGEGVSTATHPVNPIRVQALNLFSTSKTQKQLHKGMEELISILLKIGDSEVDRYMPYFIATAGIIVTNADGNITKDEYQEILEHLAGYQMFPKIFLEEISKEKDLVGLFESAVGNILSVEPGLREAMFTYILRLVFADDEFKEKEIEMVYQIGKEYFGYSEKEISTLFAAMIQINFIPNLDALC